MSRFDDFKETYDKAIKTIEAFAKDEDMATITNWLLDTENNFYIIFGLDNIYGKAQESAEVFASLLNEIAFALIDDGEICFPIIYDQPSIRFCNKEYFEDEYRKDCDTGIKVKYEPLKFLNSIEEFIVESDKAHVKWLKQCFLHDTRICGRESTIEHYQEYKAFDPTWAD
jgi:hypothetical protein